jgi:hypothetical protein
VLRGVSSNLARAEHSTQFLTGTQHELLRAAPPETQQLLFQRFQQENQGRLLGMRSQAGAVNRPFSPQETQEHLDQAIGELCSAVEQSFATFERYARTLPPGEGMKVLARLMRERDILIRDLPPLLEQMTRGGASFESILSARDRMDQVIGGATDSMTNRLRQVLPPEARAMAQAEFQLLQDTQNLAKYTLFSRALQPGSPTDFSKLPGPLPAMTGPLTPAQAQRTLGPLEQSIQQQYHLRVQVATTLPPEHLEAAVFDAQAQRDRMRVAAYRNVLSRLVDPMPPPPQPLPLR